MARRTLLETEPERWSYVIHILMDSGRIMECEGVRTGTYESIAEYADKLARDYNGSVNRLYARALGSIPPPKKEQVRFKSPQKAPAVLALPSPPAAPTPAAPPHMTRVLPTARPTPKLLVHTSNTSEN